MNNLKKIYETRNKSRLGSIGLYGFQRGELFAGWLGRGRKILELGCRDGSLTILFASGNEITGVDIDEKAINLFRQRITGSKGLVFDLNLDWPFGKGEFDGAVASEILEHFYRPEEIIKRISRSLKSDGVFVGSVPNGFSLANRARLFLGRPMKTTLADPTHVHHFSYRELKSVLEKHFEKVELVPLGRLGFLKKICSGLFSFLLVFHCQRPK